MLYLQKRDNLNLAKDPTKNAFPDVSSSGKAKVRLETALSNLEKVLEEKASKITQKETSSEELDNARQEIEDLKLKNDSIAGRLDLTIEKMKKLLGER